MHVSPLSRQERLRIRFNRKGLTNVKNCCRPDCLRYKQQQQQQQQQFLVEELKEGVMEGILNDSMPNATEGELPLLAQLFVLARFVFIILY